MVAPKHWDRKKGKKFKMPQKPTSGMNTRTVLDIGTALGCEVVVKRGTGEKVISHPAFKFRPVRFDAHSRLDAPRHLTGFVKKVWDRLDALLKGAVALAE